MSGSNTAERDYSALAYNLGFLAVLAILAGLGLAYWLDTTTRARLAPPPPQSVEILDITVSGQKFSVPANWVRTAAQRQSGFADKLDLLLPLFMADQTEHNLNASIVSQGKARTTALMLDSVFLHQFEQRQLNGVPGLIGKPLKASSGYQGETVWYDPLAFNPFVAKCVAPISENGTPSCQRVIALQNGTLLATNFPQSWLTYWREFDQAIESALSQIGTSIRR